MSVSSILLLTTNRDECDLLTESFTNSGVVVHCINAVADGDVVRFMDKALASDADRPSLIMVDLDDAHGYRSSILSKIKQHPYSLRTPLLAYSQNNDCNFVERVYEQGAISVFKRPNNWTHFAQTVLSYWGHSEVRLPTEPEDDRFAHRWSNQRTNFAYHPRFQSEQ